MKNNFVILLLTYLYNPTREEYARRSYASLRKTLVDEDTPLPLFVLAKDEHSLQVANEEIRESPFFLAFHYQPPEVGNSVDTCYAYGLEKICESLVTTTHIIFLTDDLLYNPSWFLETKRLVTEYPEGLAWSVYRSAHERHYRTGGRVGTDHIVNGLSGNGTCISVEEWKRWGVRWTDGLSWPSPEGNTLDLHHAYVRPGPRYATDKSYIQHIGAEGLHVTAGVPEYGLNWIGE